jgi:2-keto-4-pentenoate hydratase/2-oxohepta-3-ene-1,7-dioic acid hydratase in catechol pathway
MKLVRFSPDTASEPRPGLREDGTVYDLRDDDVQSLGDALARSLTGPAALEAARDAAADRDAGYTVEDVRLHAPVDDDARVICLGGVFPSHLRDRGDDLNMTPSQWLVPEPAVIGPNDPIRVPDRVAENTRPAVELGLVIGVGGRYIEQSDVYDHIAGYTIVNDITARTDWPGAMGYKLMDTFSPCGPHVTHVDAVEDPHDLSMVVRQDGTEICSGRTTGMRFTVSYLVSFLSTILELGSGDVISTGDPAGVEDSLSIGSTVELEIEEVGVLSNPVEAVEE